MVYEQPLRRDEIRAGQDERRDRPPPGTQAAQQRSQEQPQDHDPERLRRQDDHAFRLLSRPHHRAGHDDCARHPGACPDDRPQSPT